MRYNSGYIINGDKYMKEVSGNIRIGRVMSNQTDDYMTLELEDEKSGILFVQVKLSMADYGKVIAGLSNIKCTMEVRGLHGNENHIGKRHERKKGRAVISKEDYEFLMLGNENRHTQHELLVKWLETYHSEEGWHINPYLGSRGSIESADGNWNGAKAINFSYYRYVDDNES